MTGNMDTNARRNPETPMVDSRNAHFPSLLLAVFALAWIVLAIAPLYRADWLLENLLVFVAVPALCVSYRRFAFSNAAYASLFAFFLLHQVGAHYTYSEVPYEAWFESLSGARLGEFVHLERNHYDRLVHFMYGLLIAPAAVELVDHVSDPRGAWRWLLPWTFVVSHSTVFEILEALAAGVFGGELGQAYLGTQGDEWDAQRDSALAAIGAAISVAVLRWRVDPRRSSSAPSHGGPGRDLTIP